MSPPPLAFRALGCPYGANVPILYPPPLPPSIYSTKAYKQKMARNAPVSGVPLCATIGT